MKTKLSKKETLVSLNEAEQGSVLQKDNELDEIEVSEGVVTNSETEAYKSVLAVDPRTRLAERIQQIMDGVVDKLESKLQQDNLSISELAKGLDALSKHKERISNDLLTLIEKIEILSKDDKEIIKGVLMKTKLIKKPIKLKNEKDFFK